VKTATAPKPKKKAASRAEPASKRRHFRKESEEPTGSGRPLWAGSISFGLVNIPVRLYPAVREQRIAFHMLHDQDKVRLRRRIVSSETGREIHPEHIVRGFEYDKGQYVIVRDEELEGCAPEKTKTIEITDFVEMSEIDPLYFDRPYYVMPQAGASKPYRLLVEAMTRSKRVGLARLVMHEKEHLAAIRPLDGLMCIETMHFGEEIVPLSDIDDIPGEIKTADRETKAAEEIIRGLSGKFDPKDFRDTYRECIRKMVEKKATGDNVVTATEEEADGEPKKPARSATNLMAALEASLAKAKQSSGGSSKRRKSA
jgi:DNA end-binding protein Ku